MAKNKSQSSHKKGKDKQPDKKGANKVWLRTRRRVRRNILGK